MGLSHILLNQPTGGASAVDDVLCHLLPPNLVWKPVLLLCACAVKNWLRKAGRAARRSWEGAGIMLRLEKCAGRDGEVAQLGLGEAELSRVPSLTRDRSPSKRLDTR